ncbi:MAG: hypothetical protein U1F43_06825 [Myxococcota bacterium]
MWTSLVVVLALAAGEPPDASPPAAAPDASPAAVPADAAAAPAPAPTTPTRIANPRPTHLPDGVFAGPATADGDGQPMTLRLDIVDGLVTRAEARRGDLVIALRPSGAPSDLGLRFNGREGKSFLKISGGFWDAERAEGRFEGTVEGQQVTGTWQLERR